MGRGTSLIRLSVTIVHAMVFAAMPDGPCVQCVFQEPQGMIGTCDTEGVLVSAVYTIASAQFTEALKILLRKGQQQELLQYNVWDHTLERFHVTQRKGCLACSGNFVFLDGKKQQDIVKCVVRTVFSFGRM